MWDSVISSTGTDLGTPDKASCRYFFRLLHGQIAIWTLFTLLPASIAVGCGLLARLSLPVMSLIRLLSLMVSLGFGGIDWDETCSQIHLTLH